MVIAIAFIYLHRKYARLQHAAELNMLELRLLYIYQIELLEYLLQVPIDSNIWQLDTLNLELHRDSLLGSFIASDAELLDVSNEIERRKVQSYMSDMALETFIKSIPARCLLACLPCNDASL